MWENMRKLWMDEWLLKEDENRRKWESDCRLQFYAENEEEKKKRWVCNYKSWAGKRVMALGSTYRCSRGIICINFSDLWERKSIGSSLNGSYKMEWRRPRNIISDMPQCIGCSFTRRSIEPNDVILSTYTMVYLKKREHFLRVKYHGR